MEEDSGEYSYADWIIMTLNQLRRSVWKHFGFLHRMVDRKTTNKDKAVCLLCKKQLPYSIMTTILTC